MGDHLIEIKGEVRVLLRETLSDHVTFIQHGVNLVFCVLHSD